MEFYGALSDESLTKPSRGGRRAAPNQSASCSCSRDEYPGDQRADWPGRARDFLAACNAGALEFSRCHVGVMRIVTNGGKWQQKLKREGES